MKSPPRALCLRCRGTGMRPLSKSMADTLECVPILWVSTMDIAASHPKRSLKRTALINRLNALVRLRLVERAGTGRELVWRRA